MSFRIGGLGFGGAVVREILAFQIIFAFSVVPCPSLPSISLEKNFLSLLKLKFFSFIFINYDLKCQVEEMPEPSGFVEKLKLVDGSNNAYRFFVFANGTSEFQYRGIRASESSSGEYNGGPDVKKALNAAETAEIKRLFDEATKRVADHFNQDRPKGVGIVQIEPQNTKFLISFKSAESAAFLAKLASLKS